MQRETNWHYPFKTETCHIRKKKSFQWHISEIAWWKQKRKMIWCMLWIAMLWNRDLKAKNLKLRYQESFLVLMEENEDDFYCYRSMYWYHLWYNFRICKGNKSTLVNSIKSSWTWKEINKIPELHALHHITINSQKLPIQSMLITGVISGVVTPKDKTKSTPLANKKVRSITKICG